jgi:hypothetical protein
MSDWVARVLGPRVQEPSAVSAASLVVQTALLEYRALRDEVLQVFQRMAATAALGLAIAGAAASIALSRDLGAMEPPVLLVASFLIMLNSVAVISMSLHVATITRWLQHIARDQVRPVISEAAARKCSVPADLLGWEAYYSSRRIHEKSAFRLRRFVWLVLIPLPCAAGILQAQALADLLQKSQGQYPTSWILLGMGVLLDVAAGVYSVALLRQIAAVRKSKFSAADVNET